MNVYRFCPLCGDELRERHAGDRLRPACDCGFVHWRNPSPAAALVLLKGDRCLWVRRAHDPFRGAWSLPSGFLEWDEDIRDCALREAREETGLEAEIEKLLGVYSCHDDPRGHSLLVVYIGRATGGTLRAGDDADALDWYPLGAPPETIAWESHVRVLRDLKESLRPGSPD